MKGAWVLLAIVGGVAVAGVFFVMGTRSGAFERDLEERFAQVSLKQTWQDVERSMRSAQAYIDTLGCKLDTELIQLRHSKGAQDLMGQVDVTVRDFRATMTQVGADLEKRWGDLSNDARYKATETFASIKSSAAKLQEETVKTFSELAAAEKLEKGQARVQAGLVELKKLADQARQLP